MLSAASRLTQPCRGLSAPTYEDIVFNTQHAFEILCKEETRYYELEVRTTIPLPRGTIALQTSTPDRANANQVGIPNS